MTTLIVRVGQRLPYTSVALVGTLDRNSTIRLVVELQDCLADLPTALVLDLGYLAVSDAGSLHRLALLATQAHRWPGALTHLCAATPNVARLLDQETPTDAFSRWPSVQAGQHAADQVAVPRRRFAALPPTVHSPAQARTLVDDSCRGWGVPRLSKLGQLIVSELVSNAVVHARTSMTVIVRLVERSLQIAVRDLDPRPLFRPDASVGLDAETGRGLLVLDGMADDWGTMPTSDGKLVWATVRLP
jgi:hypothetical protein